MLLTLGRLPHSILLLSTLVAGSVFAQVAEIRGSVSDSQGGAIVGASVTVTNTDTGLRRTLTTDNDGRFRAVGLEPGPCEVTVAAKGLRSEARLLTLTVGGTAELRIAMSPAQFNESIDVKEEAGLIETAKADIAGVVTREQVMDIPVLNRGYIGLEQLLPGGGPSLASDARFGTQTSFGGSDLRSQYSVLVDGSDLDDPIYGISVLDVSQDAVQEFRVVHNTFDAEYGRATTAVVNVLTKSGTNNWDGMFTYYGQFNPLNARNTFSDSKPPFNSQRFTGILGGSIISGKTHFFVSADYLGQHTPEIVALPASNPFATTWNGSYPAYTKEGTAEGKLDHSFNPNNTGFLRYLFEKQGIGSAYPLSTNVYSIIFHDMLGQWAWAGGSGKLNSLQLEFLDSNIARSQNSNAPELVRPSFTSGAATNLPQGFPRQRYALNDTFYWNKGRNSFKVGTRTAYENLHFEGDFYGYGAWTFSTDLPFDLDAQSTWPTSLMIGSGPSVVDYKNSELSFFFQDDIKLARRFTLNAGIRYDLETNLRDNAYIASLVKTFPQLATTWQSSQGPQTVGSPRGNDWHSVEPRLGFAWDISGNGKTVVRGGLGGYTARNRPWFDINGESVNGEYAVTVTNPNQLSCFPSITCALKGLTVQQYASTVGGRTLYIPSNDLSLPYVGSATAGVQRALWGKDTVVQVDFIRQIQTDLPTGYDADLPLAGPISTHSRPLGPQLGPVTMLGSSTKSWYSALQAQFQTRFKRVYTQVSYTWSKTISDGNDDNTTTISDPFHVLHNNDRGLDEYDVPQALSWMSMVSLPYSFQIATIVSLRDGTPYNLIAGADLSGVGAAQDQRPAGLLKDAGAGYYGTSQNLANLAIINTYRAPLDLPAVTMPQLTQGDGIEDLDLRLTRIFRITEGTRAEVMLEAYDAFNHANYLAPNGTISSPAFLIRTAALDPRQVQIAVRFRRNSPNK